MNLFFFGFLSYSSFVSLTGFYKNDLSYFVIMISLYFIVSNPFLVYTEVVHREFSNLHGVLNWRPHWFMKW